MPFQRHFKCELCGAAFKRKEHVDRHVILRHKSTQRAVPTDSPSLLANDSISPSNDAKLSVAVRSYVCEHCGKTFVLNYHLRRHLKTHMLLYECREWCSCHFALFPRQSLNIHQLTISTNQALSTPGASFFVRALRQQFCSEKTIKTAYAAPSTGGETC